MPPMYGKRLRAVQISSSVHHSCLAAQLLLQVQLHVPRYKMSTCKHARDQLIYMILIFQEVFSLNAF